MLSIYVKEKHYDILALIEKNNDLISKISAGFAGDGNRNGAMTVSKN
jgi:hypothetical protein